MGLGVDASNACIPPGHPLTRQCPPLPSATRGEPICLDGQCGRLTENDDRRAPSLAYASGKLIVVREIDVRSRDDDDDDETSAPSASLVGPDGRPSTSAFVYRGHSAPIRCVKFNLAGTYVASADARGKLRVWAYDHPEHLPRLDVQLLAGPVRDVSWDAEGKRIAAAGDGLQGKECARVVQWDTGVKSGDLAIHARKKASSVAFRPGRPMRIATGGTEDASVFFHKGPPFVRVVGDGVVAEKCHERGAVHSLRYNADGTMLASAGTDGSVCFYEGKTMALLLRMEKVHASSVFGCSWDRAGTNLLTCGADGFARLIDAREGKVVREWDVAAAQRKQRFAGGGSGGANGEGKVPKGAMQLGCTFIQGDVPVSVGYNGQITVLSAPGGDPSAAPRIITGHQAPISSMALGRGSIFTADTDGVFVEWDARRGTARGRIVPPPDADDPDLSWRVHGGATVVSLAVCGGALHSAGWDDRVRRTDVSSDNGKDAPRRICDGGDGVALAAQPNAVAAGRSLVLVMTVDGLVLLRGGEAISELVRLPYAATAVCLSTDDSTAYAASDRGDIHVYAVDPSDRANPLTETRVLKGAHLKAIHSLALSNDGSMLASADVRDVCIHSASDDDAPPVVGKGRWCFHTQRISSLAWSPDDSILASGGHDDDIFLWCPAKKTKRVHYRFAHRGGVTGLAFLGGSEGGGGGSGNDGWTLVSAGNDGCVNWWNVGDDVKAKFQL